MQDGRMNVPSPSLRQFAVEDNSGSFSFALHEVCRQHAWCKRTAESAHCCPQANAAVFFSGVLGGATQAPAEWRRTLASTPVPSTPVPRTKKRWSVSGAAGNKNTCQHGNDGNRIERRQVSAAAWFEGWPSSRARGCSPTSGTHMLQIGSRSPLRGSVPCAFLRGTHCWGGSPQSKKQSTPSSARSCSWSPASARAALLQLVHVLRDEHGRVDDGGRQDGDGGRVNREPCAAVHVRRQLRTQDERLLQNGRGDERAGDDGGRCNRGGCRHNGGCCDHCRCASWRQCRL